MFISVRAAVTVQLAAVVLAMLVGLILLGRQAGLAMLLGGAGSLANTGMLWWRWRQGAKSFHCDAGRHVQAFYRSALERFFIVGAGLAAGFMLMNDAPFPLLAGFVVGQLAWMVASLTLRART